MKKISLVFLILHNLCFSSLSMAVEPEVKADHSKGFSIGTDVGSIAGDLVVGLRLSSPSFFRDLMRITASGHVGWVPNVMPTGGEKLTWLPFGLYKVGISVGSFIYQLPVRVSGSAELALITPHKDISSKKVVLGTHGAMDIEFFVNPKRSGAVFVNLGGMGLFSPIADKLQGQPSFANGFTTSFGYRYYF